MASEVEKIIDEVPELRSGFISAERLSGGLCNQTYKVRTESGAYVLRINSKQNEYVGLTRQSEAELMKRANALGIAPRVIAAADPERYVVTEFLEGRMLTSEDLREMDVRERVIGRLKQIHGMVGSTARLCSPYHLIHGYRTGAEQLGVRAPDGLSAVLRRVETIAHERSGDKEHNGVFCHNDSFPCNIIDTGAGLQVIDWELSGVGDAYFELAIIPFSNRFSEADDRAWLRLYFGSYEEERYRILQDMKFMNMAREVVWGMLYGGLTKDESHHDFNYYKFAEYVIQRIQQGVYQL